MTRAPAIMLMGPTGSGKTELAVELAGRFPVGLISVDSALVYRGMDIGTAKPSPGILARAPHSLVDIRDPADRYSAGEFRRDALVAMEALTAASRVPLLVGGTLLYFRALRKGLARLPEPDEALRGRLDAEAAKLGWPALHERLRGLDPVSATRIHPNDAQRIQRALEVFEQTGTALSTLHSTAPDEGVGHYRYIRVGLVPSRRTELNKNIEKRFNAMMKNGLLDEVSALFGRGDLNPDLPSMRAVGYRQLWQYLAGECSLEEAVRRAIVATRRLAKRQMTWLRSERLDLVIDPFDSRPATQVIDFLGQELGWQGESIC